MLTDTILAHDTLTGVLGHWVTRSADRLCHAELDEDGTLQERLTYRELDRRARAIAAHLQATTSTQRGRTLILGLSGSAFLEAYFGCLYAGRTAVPIVTPTVENLAQVEAIIDHVAADADADCALVGPALRSLVATHGARLPILRQLPLIESPSIDSREAERHVSVVVSPKAIAHFIYTSGSTAPSKGVALDHAAVMHNLRYTSERWHYGDGDSHLSFGAPFHSAGLMVGYLMPVFAGGVGYSMRPHSFSADPMRFLRAIEHLRIKHTAFGDSALEQCVRALSAGRDQFNLTGWRTVVIGGEPLQSQTLARFLKLTRPLGFSGSRVVTAYGMTEAAGLITTGRLGAPPRAISIDLQALSEGRVERIPADAPAARVMIGCGMPSHEVEVAIVDLELGTQVPAATLGELWFTGPSLFREYFGHRPIELETFRGRDGNLHDGYFRSGDLAFVVDGEVFVVGRKKEAISLKGRTYFPLDIELCSSAAHAVLELAPSIAFGHGQPAPYRVVVCQEVPVSAEAHAGEIAGTIMKSVQARLGLDAVEVQCVRAGGLPRVYTSAKKPRLLCRDQYLSGDLPILEAAEQ